MIEIFLDKALLKFESSIIVKDNLPDNVRAYENGFIKDLDNNLKGAYSKVVFKTGKSVFNITMDDFKHEYRIDN